MNRPLYILCCGLAVIASIALTSAQAASVEGQTRNGFGRLNFGFENPTAMRASVEGSTATLSFDEPLTQSPQSIRAALPTYVTGATLSADKKTLTLTTSKPYRIRQFTSGNKVGLDFVGQGDEAAAKDVAELSTREPETAENVLTTKPAKPTSEKAAPKKSPTKQAVVTKKATVEKPSAPAAVPPAAASDPILSTVEPEVPSTETAQVKVETPVATPTPAQKTEPESAPLTEPVLTTQDAPPTDETLLTTKATTETPAPPAAATPPPEPVAVVASPAPATVAKPFIATAKTTENETTLHFPWPNRTAAAVFARGQNIWVVFSQYKDVNTGLLSTVLSKNVVGITQYADAGHTILRIATTGNLNARATLSGNGYGWDITLTQSSVKPALDIAIAADGLDGTMRLILGVFDVAEPLTFYDPIIGDKLTIFAAYEQGRAVSNKRSYPQFSILATSQGVAMVNTLPDLDISQTRSGLIVSTSKGLALSENLPNLVNNSPVAGISANSSVMIPYDQWYVPPERFLVTLHERLLAVATASKANKAESMMELVKLYLSLGMGPEAGGVLSQIREQFPQYFINNKLALLSGVSHALMDHMDLAATDFNAPELNDSEEAMLWRQVAALYALPSLNIPALPQQATSGTDAAGNSPHLAPATAEQEEKATATVTNSSPSFQYLKFSRPFIRFYPPRIRQKLAMVASDAYLASGQEEKALAVFDTLLRDGILTPLALDAEFVQAMVARKKSEDDQALQIFDRLAKQSKNLRIKARALHMATLMRYHKSLMTADAAAEIIETARLSWRGDKIERAMLQDLIHIYTDAKRYDDVLRTQKSILDGFADDPDAVTISADMGELFQRIFLGGLADEMTPLKALSLFDEFRGLTPLGENGDKIIQGLADRLAAIDLLDRASQLLEHQIKFRSTGESRSRIGARLALLHLLNKHPKEALSVLEVTNYGGNSPESQLQRRQITAEALSKLDKNEEALGVLFSDTSSTGTMLRLDILWKMKDWPNVVNHAEDILGARPNLTEPLTLKETEVLLKLAIAYTFEGDYTQLRYLRDYYSGLIPDTAYKQIFDYITNDTTPLDPEDFDLIAQQISRTEGFLGTFKEKIAAGKLSEAVK